jgi:hypothetical protein
MIDIVTWLREAASRHNNYRCDEAADRIEALEKALRTLVNHCECLDECCFHTYDTASDCRFFKARAALEGKE